MKLTIESTPAVVTLDGVECRLWEGTTEQGTPCQVFVHRLGSEGDAKEFETLTDHGTPQVIHAEGSRPTDEYIRRVVRHLIDVMGGSDDQTTWACALLADHLLWAIGDQPRFNLHLDAGLRDAVARCDEVDRQAKAKHN